MSSTEFTIGMGDGRNSSKVLKPPGGGSSDIFGITKNHNQEPLNQKENQTRDRLFGPSSIEPMTPSKTNRMKSNIFGNEEQNYSKQNKKKFVQRNPITGETTEIDLEKNGDKNETDSNEENEINGDKNVETNGAMNEDIAKGTEGVDDILPVAVTTKPTKPTGVRVRQPPGGKSSGIF